MLFASNYLEVNFQIFFTARARHSWALFPSYLFSLMKVNRIYYSNSGFPTSKPSAPSFTRHWLEVEHTQNKEQGLSFQGTANCGNSHLYPTMFPRGVTAADLVGHGDIYTHVHTHTHTQWPCTPPSQTRKLFSGNFNSFFHGAAKLVSKTCFEKLQSLWKRKTINTSS